MSLKSYEAKRYPPTGREVVYLDIMRSGRFVCQLPFEYCPLFPVSIDELTDYVFSKRPSLKGQTITIAFSGNRV